MDTSYLSQQVNTIIGQLHGLFDEIGVSNHDRETREAELFTALSEALNNQLHSVAAEKEGLVEEAQKVITDIRHMEASLDDRRNRRSFEEDDSLKVTFPLTRCLQSLQERHLQVKKVHRERFEQVKKLVQALESYSLHLEPSFVKIDLPPTGPNQSIPSTFDLSPSYIDKLDDEFTRVYEEYSRRVVTVKSTCETIIQLWAELGTPQAQTDGTIVKYYRDAPEQLGLHHDDIQRLRSRRDKLAEEKKARERRLKELRAAVEALWEKLGVEDPERKSFLNSNRGCGVRQINEFEDELARLNELKRQNLHLFVEDARCKLQELWDALYLSEDEMLEFTPAFSDVYSDALLEAHEREIARLEALKEQRAPTLSLVERHRSLVQERDDLAASSQDASRLMMRGQKGEKRDPGKLLREEKQRKRIAKELPKITAELSQILETWEDEYGRPFLVHGERYLDVIEDDAAKAPPGPRSKTPAGPPPSANRNTRTSTLSRANSVNKPTPGPRNGAKTPVLPASNNGTLKRGQSNPVACTNGRGSPTRIPGRPPLANLKNGTNSPERPRPESQGSLRRMPPNLRAPPPKMRDLTSVPELETPANLYRSFHVESSAIVRQVEPEDVYDDRCVSQQSYRRPESRQDWSASYRSDRYPPPHYPQAPSVRQISNTSTAVSGSENWETYDDTSEPEQDASDAYYERMRAARGKRMSPEVDFGQTKRVRGLAPAPHGNDVMLDHDGNRIVSGSEWTDEDAY